MAATLVYSSKWFPKSTTLQVWEANPADILMNRIMAEKCKTHLVVTRNMYAYIPSQEYKETIVRLKGIKNVNKN
jgi:hypothetical protein